MRFYEECVRAAEQVGGMLTEEERALFVGCAYKDLCRYDATIGVWVTDTLLPNNPYLHNALVVVGCASPCDMSLYMMEFIQHYWRLKHAAML